MKDVYPVSFYVSKQTAQSEQIKSVLAFETTPADCRIDLRGQLTLAPRRAQVHAITPAGHRIDQIDCHLFCAAGKQGVCQMHDAEPVSICIQTFAFQDSGIG